MSNNTLDAGIPMLTEVIPIPTLPLTLALEAPVVPVASMPEAEPEPLLEHVIEPALEPVPLPAMSLSDKERWEQLEQDLRERVLAQLMGRIDLMLEQRVRDCLADVLQSSVERLASDLREGLRLSIKEAVNRVVSQEIADVRPSIK